MNRSFKFASEEYYHIYNRGTDKRKIFLDKKDHQRFVLLLFLANATEKLHASDMWKKPWQEIFSIGVLDTIVNIGAYCLMPNHFHLLIRAKDDEGVSVFMKKLLTGYSMYFNKKYHRTGSLFEGAFKASHIDDDRHLKYMYSYIHLNPIGIIDSGWKGKHIEDKEKSKEFLDNYQFSSLFDYKDIKRPESIIINRSVFPDYFNNACGFDAMIKEWVDFELKIKD